MKRITLMNGKVVLQPETEATFAPDQNGDLVEIIEHINRPWRTILDRLEKDYV